MPHAVMNTGDQTGSALAGSRELVPGVQPGGSRVGAPTKPALLLQDINVLASDLEPDLSAPGAEDFVLYLVLSQESSLTPHLLLPVAEVLFESYQASGVGAVSVPVHLEKKFMAQGTIWCPAYVGWRIIAEGAWTQISLQMHIDYEVVDIPWMDWFLRWDFLDNTPTGQTEY